LKSSRSKCWFRAWRRFATPAAILWAFVLASSLLGLTGFNRYGESWDEQVDFQYGEDAVAYYDAPASYWEEYGNLRYYGPAYLAAAHTASAYLRPLFAGWDTTDVRHLLNHLTFQVATLALYFLCRMFVGPRASLIGALLFASQPLLFGHSFINQKDVPFMAAFLVAAALGMRLADPPSDCPVDLPGSLRRDWKTASRRKRALFIALVLGAGAVCLELLVLMRVALPTLQRTVAAAYYGESFSVLNRWFAQLAQEAHRLPVDAYVQKATTLYMGFRWGLVLFSLAAVGIAGSLVFRSALALSMIPFASSLLWGISGGVAAGLAASIRAPGAAVAALVILVVLLNRRWERVPALGVFLAVAAATCYATWPALHGAPLQRFWESLTVLSRYPWSSGIVYAGAIYQPQDLPWHYLPGLMVIQFTLPAVILAIAGGGIAVRLALGGGGRRAEIAALLVWFAAPLVAAGLAGSTVYGNFRQFLFATPPLFVFAGIALEALAARIRSAAVVALIAAAALLPGILGIVRLHPYEYVYYNALVGGVEGAFRSYEMDYWCTSYREAMAWINQAAPVDAEVAAAPPQHVAQRYARPDLRVFYAQSPEDLGGRQPVYGLGCGRGNNDLGFFQEYSVAHEVAIQGARLAVIRDFEQPDPHGQD